VKSARLREYKTKRNFEATPEPDGAATEPAHAGARFVIQEHHARSLHWDVRLERDGVLVSWAVPKGIPLDPSENHLAVHTEDHPIDYLNFAGEIPRGEYGAGAMTVWDTGTYETHEWTDAKVVVTLEGARVNGRYALFQTKGRNWMIHRMDPPAAGRTPAPTDLRPMLATLVHDVPSGGDWAYEMKWDGVRAFILVQGGRVRVTNRNGGDVSAGYPELRALGEDLGSTEVLLDGEIVALDDHSRPSFQLLQRRMHVREPAALRRLEREVPVVFMIFDILWLDGRLMIDLPYTQRRRELETLALGGARWQVPAVSTGDGDAALNTSRELGLEGMVAKRLDSRYEPGRRSSSWRKIKHDLRQEFVLGGWTPGEGWRSGGIGALLLGYYDHDGVLRYAGKVGTGFSENELERLSALLAPLEQDENPFAGAGVPRVAHFVEPRLVAEVRFAEWTAGGRIRQPAYLGLRDDRVPTEVVREG
jgi:bifunctional non-homologous end joining protein LigD